jgi:hypothetical protein
VLIFTPCVDTMDTRPQYTIVYYGIIPQYSSISITISHSKILFYIKTSYLRCNHQVKLRKFKKKKKITIFTCHTTKIRPKTSATAWALLYMHILLYFLCYVLCFIFSNFFPCNGFMNECNSIKIQLDKYFKLI